MTQEEIDLLERTLIAALYAIWKAQGKRKKIVTLPDIGNASVDDHRFALYLHAGIPDEGRQ